MHGLQQQELQTKREVISYGTFQSNSPSECKIWFAAFQLDNDNCSYNTHLQPFTEAELAVAVTAEVLYYKISLNLSDIFSWANPSYNFTVVLSHFKYFFEVLKKLYKMIIFQSLKVLIPKMISEFHSCFISFWSCDFKFHIYYWQDLMLTKYCFKICYHNIFVSKCFLIFHFTFSWYSYPLLLHCMYQ